MDILELTTILLSLASVFSIINLRFLKLPQTIGLMILALILSILVTAVGIVFPNVFETVAQLTKEFDFSLVLINVMLPFLLFAGAISINLQDLLEDKLTILLVATFGVFFSTFVVGTSLFWLIQQPFFGLNQIGLGSTKGEIDQHHIENLPPRILFENLTEILIDMKYNFGSIDTTTGKINSSADQEAKDKGSMVISENEAFKYNIIVANA